MSSIMLNPTLLEGKEVSHGYRILKYLSRGAFSLVYKAQRMDPEETVAIKLTPVDRLPKKWQEEIRKAAKLRGITEVVQYLDHFEGKIENVEFLFTVLEYVEGVNLAQYCAAHPEEITMPFLKNLAIQVLRAFYAMTKVNESHEDLHEGNILVTSDPRVLEETLRIKVTDFGTGFQSSTWDASDDYFQLAKILHSLLEQYIDPAQLNIDDRYIYNKFVNEFLKKIIRARSYSPFI